MKDTTSFKTRNFLGEATEAGHVYREFIPCQAPCEHFPHSRSLNSHNLVLHYRDFGVTDEDPEYRHSTNAPKSHRHKLTGPDVQRPVSCFSHLET